MPGPPRRRGDRALSARLGTQIFLPQRLFGLDTDMRFMGIKPTRLAMSIGPSTVRDMSTSSRRRSIRGGTAIPIGITGDGEATIGTITGTGMAMGKMTVAAGVETTTDANW